MNAIDVLLKLNSNARRALAAVHDTEAMIAYDAARVVRTQTDGWHIAVREAGPQYIAWAMRVPTTAHDPLYEPVDEDTWIAFGDTVGEAVAAVLREVPALDQEESNDCG